MKNRNYFIVFSTTLISIASLNHAIKNKKIKSNPSLLQTVHPLSNTNVHTKQDTLACWGTDKDITTKPKETEQKRDTKPQSGRYLADIKKGHVGAQGNTPDIPSDNVFHIHLDDIERISEAYLTYDLYGVKDKNSVSRSINDNHATGGVIIQPDTTWTHQKEQIPVHQLKQGDNVIRFSSLLENKYGYTVRNVAINIPVTRAIQSNRNNTPLISLDRVCNYFNGNTAYISGQIKGNLPKGNVKITANGQPLCYEKGGFFGIITRSKEIKTESWNIEITATNNKGWETKENIYYKKAEFPVYTDQFTHNLSVAKAEVNPGDTITLEVQEASLFIDSASLTKKTTLSISTLREIDLMPTQSGLINVTGKHSGYRMLPHGTQFNKPVRIGLPYDSTKIPNGYTEKDIRTYYFDEDKRSWTALAFDSIDTKNHIAYALSTHFTDFINGVIQVPESPETQGYTPTSIKDLALADPAAGIVQVPPPSVNNRGNANLNFPLKIPTGRQGMAPQLNISYSSEGSDGWLGLGWGLAIPYISVEVRWGVPLYDESFETETYLISGEQLSPVAHRSEYISRESDKQFYPRVEGSFNRIIRKGDNPTNYWWEVTSTSGIKYYYGSSDGEDVSEDYVLTDDSGNIAEWKLAKVIDLNGNSMSYEYQSVTYSDAPLSSGKSTLYPKNINYTGYNNESGNYNINFSLQENTKSDAHIFCNYGFPVSDASLLDQINITYNGDTIRSYQLDYITGGYNKTLLQSISELDAEGEEFYSNSFQYFNEVSDENEYIPFKEEVSINTEDDDLNGGSLLSLASSSVIESYKGWSVGGGLYVGVGTGWNVLSKNLTVGGSYAYNHTEGQSINTLMDLNGDRLPDKIFVNDDKMYYRPQLKDNSFGEVYEISGGGVFNKTKSNSHTGGFSATAYATVGASVKVTRSETDNYFSDVNGDGLVDYVVDGSVRYNVLDSDNNPSFTTNLDDVGIPTTEDGEIDTTMLMPDYDDWLEQVEQNPLNDIVRMWTAPYDGTISITGDINLEYPDVASDYDNADGIKASIQVRNGESGVIWADSIYSSLYSTLTPSGVDNINVSEGDRVYFRLQSRFNGMYDQVEWSPTVTYNDKSETTTDINGLPYYSYNAADDYLLSSEYGSSLPADGEIRIASHLVKPVTTDDIDIIYVLVDSNDVETIVATQTIEWQATYNDSIIFEDITVDGENERLDVRVQSETGIDWSALELNTKVTYTASTDSDVSIESLQDIVLYPVSYFRVFNVTKEEIPTPFTITGKKFITVSPVFEPIVVQTGLDTYDTILVDGSFTLSVKRSGQAPEKKNIEIIDSKMKGDTSLSGFMASTGEELHVEIHTLDSIVYAALDGTVKVSYKDSSIYGYDISDTTYTDGYLELEDLRPYSIWDDTLHSDLMGKTYLIEKTQVNAVSFYTTAGVFKHAKPGIFGANYRCWGQFSYMKGRCQYIDEDDLEYEVSEDVNTDVTINEDDSYDEQKADFESQTGDNQVDNIFIKLYPSGETGCWTGYNDTISVSSTKMGCGRRGDNDLLEYDDLVEVQLSEGSGKRAIIKKSKTKDHSVKAGVSASFGSFTASKVSTSTEIQTDFIDMNGDGYPDLINGNNVQYSTPRGGLSEITLDMDEVVSASEGTIYGFSVNNKDPESKTNEASKGNTPIVVGIGTSDLTTSDDYTLIDINGDGLPDRVYKGNEVKLNYGYSFSETQNWGIQYVRESKSGSVDIPLGFVGINIDKETGELTGGSVQLSLFQGSFLAGIGASSNNSYALEQLMDVNGDGLIDQVSTTSGDDPKTSVKLNTGTGFVEATQWDDIRTPHNQYSINANLDVAVTFGFSPFIFPVKIVFNPTVQGGLSFSRTTESLMDFDGDGYPDYLTSNKDNELSYKPSNYGKTNILKQVDNALGSTITLDYEKIGNTVKIPQQKWTLSEVTVFDNHSGDGADYTKTAYEYGEGYYDRYERTFYGFDTLVTKQLDTENDDKVYRYSVKTFENSNYYSQGILLKEEMFDADSNLYTSTENTYLFKNISDSSIVTAKNLPEFSDGESWFPFLVETTSSSFEGQEEAGKTYRKSFEYDSYANITKYTDYGDEKVNDDIIIGTVTYHSDDDNYLYSSPASIEVVSDGTLYRKRETDIDNNGNLTEVRSYISESEYASVDLEYDDYGNITKKTLPENANSERMFYDYTYDEDNHTFIEEVNDAFGYSSSSEYDYHFGAVLSTTDLNNHTTNFSYDSKGRLTQVTGPKEIEAGVEFTIQHTYYPFDDVAWALTEHYDPANPDDLIETSVFVDGLGRGIQTKKDVSIYQDSLSPDVDMMVVSGLIEYDAFGREISSYQPLTEEKGNTGIFNQNIDNISSSTIEYDVLDRTIKTTLPDETETNISYAFEQDKEGNEQFAVTTTDALGNATTQYIDARNKQTSVKMPGDIWVSTIYDAIGQTLEVTDHDGNTTTSTYDLLGRRLERNHPDAGITTWTYDKVGNLLTKQLAHIYDPITYSYDYNRLTDITYPDNEYNNVHYEYGEAGADENRAGRIKTVEDGTGAQLFYYGNMGEVTQITRAISVPDNGTYAFKTYWEYDSWNRIQKLIYPDGEELSYSYNSGGKLASMSGEKGLSEYEYVNRIGYNKFEQRTYISYGNGTQTSYSYDTERRWLSNLLTTTSTGRIIQNNNYTYDAVGNILQLTNTAGVSTGDGQYGGAVTHNYTYDDRYQLISANGNYQSNEKEYKYNLTMEYGNTGQILSKSQENLWKLTSESSDEWQTTDETSYDYTYNYEGQKPHIVTSINNTSANEDYVYQYDASGNNISADEPGLDSEREIIWTEENRIAAIKSQGNVSHYVYDASGERVLKLHSNSLSISINGVSSGVSEVNDDYTIYPNAYFVVNSGQYTKHFYIEGSRILSKIGSDDPEDLFYQGDDSGTGDDDIDYSEKEDALESTISSNMNSFGLTWYRNSNGEVPSKYIKNYLLALENGNQVGSTTQDDDSEYTEDISDSLLATDPDYEVSQYYVLPDHLGSASFITDINGETYQHLEYLPFGEVFVEERNTEQDRFTYLYNSKELDESTGFYYYGARYYNPRDAMFLGVDRFAEKYISLTPYQYCANNPIIYTDPTGDIIVLNGIKTLFKGSDDQRLSQFGSLLSNTMGGKVDVSFNSNDADEYDYDVGLSLSLKEGDVLSKDEQAIFDKLNSLNSSAKDFNIGLGGINSNGEAVIDMPKGNFYDLNLEDGGDVYDVALNIGLLCNMPEKKGFGSSNMILLGLTKENLIEYNQLSNKPINNIMHAKHSNITRPSYLTKVGLTNGRNVSFMATHTKIGIQNHTRGNYRRTEFSIVKLPGIYNIVK